MANFCQNCGNKLKGTDKFCTKCGTPIVEQNNKNTIDSENIQETVDNLKETMGNVSVAVKEKAKQAVQYSQEVIQNEQFRNEQADTLKEKAKQAQDYLKSDEFKNVKTETVNKTKGNIKNFFSCNINNNDDYVKAEKQGKYCLYTIFAVIALTIALFPFYDKWFWLNDGLWKSVLHILSVLSVISKAVVIPVCIIAFIKHYIIHTKVIAYRAINSNIQKQGINGKKTLFVLLASVVVCLVMTPVMNKADDNAYHNYSSDDSYSDLDDSYSDLVETCDGESGLQFKMTIDEYIKEYNKKEKETVLSKEIAESNENGEVISYLWGLGKDREIMLLAYKDTKKIREIRYICPQSNFNNSPEPFLADMSNVFGIIDKTIDADKMEDIIHNASDIGNYYDKGINYGISGNKDKYSVSMLAVDKDTVQGLYDNVKTTSNGGTSSSSTSSGTAATDFKIIGGSSNVTINDSGTNYTVTCPYCGYTGGAAGAYEIQSELSKHKAGETADINLASMCASKFQGGCRQLSDYYVTVKFE